LSLYVENRASRHTYISPSTHEKTIQHIAAIQKWHQRAHCLNMAQRVYLITDRRMTQQCGYPTQSTYELHEGDQPYIFCGRVGCVVYGVWAWRLDAACERCSALWHRIAVVLAITYADGLILQPQQPPSLNTSGTQSSISSDVTLGSLQNTSRNPMDLIFDQGGSDGC